MPVPGRIGDSTLTNQKWLPDFWKGLTFTPIPCFMFRQCARHQLRRYLHTGTSVASQTKTFGRRSHPAYVLGASAAIATYFAWTWNSNSRWISLDSEPAIGALSRVS